MSFGVKALRLVCFAAAAIPLAAYGSYGGGPSCGADFGCHFLFWGLILGVAGGVPFSVLGFILLHLVFCNRARSKGKQVLLGAIVGTIAFGIAAALAALMAARTIPGQHERYPLIAFVAVFLVFAIASVLHARSNPPQPSGQASSDAG